MAKRSDTQGRLDDAARAGWLYYVAGRTQDEIANAMGISRQSAQRLVSLAVAERLIKVRLDHPISACLELAEGLRKKYDLKHAEIVPSDPGGSSSTVGIAEAGAGEIERWLKRPDPIIIARRDRSDAESRCRSAAADGMPAAPYRVADRQYRAGRVGRLLQRHLLDGRCHQGAAFSHASAGPLCLHRGARHAA